MFVKPEEKAPGELHERSDRENGEALDDASKMLLKAAAIIEERGWCQNKLESPDGRVCFAGAMKLAAYGTTWPEKPGAIQPVMERAWNRFEDAMGVTRGLASRWNDADGRTQDEVVSKIRSVALGA